MNANVTNELLSATDTEIDDAMQFASPIVLQGLLYQLTGDTEVIAMPPGNSGKFGVGREMANDADAATLRAKGAAFLKQYRDKCRANKDAGNIDIGPAERLHQSLSLTAGHKIPEHELPIWQEETAFDRWARGVRWSGGKPPKNIENFKVALIGTGISGLNVAVQLKRAGIPFVVFEKNPEVGGSWFENRYPGARVDTSSRGYTHLFSYDYPFEHSYCPRDENLKYFKWVADNFEVRENMEFNTEVKSMVWDHASALWTLTTQSPSGPNTWQFNAVISCVGFLSRPQLPDIKGMDTFKGASFHTAAWPAGLSVEGKRVAVVGSAASGYQTTPVIAETAAHTYLYQRKPNWCLEDSTYLQKLPPQASWLDRNFPFYSNFVRFRIGALINPDTMKAGIMVDPEFDDPHALSAGNKASRDASVEFIQRKLASRPDLIEKMIPNFPPMASRPIRVDSNYCVYDALLQDNVELVTDSIERITPTGIVSGGVEREVDIIVFATGFKANDYLWPMEVRGKGGVRIEDIWAEDGPRAYLGAMVPEFPNLFMCYGPNSNNFGGFTVVDLLELVAQFSLRCIAGLIESGQSSVEVTHDGYWRFASILDEMDRKMIYMDPRANSYYQHGGRSCVNGPIDIRRMWRWLNNPAGTSAETDAGLRPYFGEDLVVG